jgi:hypothetical protein
VAKLKKNVSIGVVIIAMVILSIVSGSVMAARPISAGSESSVLNVQTSSQGSRHLPGTHRTCSSAGQWGSDPTDREWGPGFYRCIYEKHGGN